MMVIGRENIVSEKRTLTSDFSHDQGLVFGKYLRFWRTTKKISQEHLAYELNCSPKHISFLENGHTHPSQSLILRLSDALFLSKVDTNHLLVAAGFRPAHNQLEDSPDELQLLNKSLKMVLQAVGNSPALIRDRLGNIKMVNRTLVVSWRKWLGSAIDDPELMNTYRLFFSDRGWKPYIRDWPQLAQIFLLTLKQEILLSYDAEAEILINKLAATKGIPKNWDNTDQMSRKRPSFSLMLEDPETKETYTNVICSSVIGNLSQNIESSLFLEVHCQVGFNPLYTAAEIEAMTDVSHPLLPY